MTIKSIWIVIYILVAMLVSFGMAGKGPDKRA